MALKCSEYPTAQALNEDFAARIGKLLQTAIERRGEASLIVSGGNTPKPLFALLRKQELAWDKVTISLADERWVDADDDASNEKMVRQHLLQDAAAAATFIGLKQDTSDAADAVDICSQHIQQASRPFDVLILGMGEDGHTASLFPCSEQLPQAMNLRRTAPYIAVQPTTAPHQRMSLSFAALLHSRSVFLHFTGDKKRQVLNDAMANTETPLPIAAVAQAVDVELVWAP